MWEFPARGLPYGTCRARRGRRAAPIPPAHVFVFVTIMACVGCERVCVLGHGDGDACSVLCMHFVLFASRCCCWTCGSRSSTVPATS